MKLTTASAGSSSKFSLLKTVESFWWHGSMGVCTTGAATAVGVAAAIVCEASDAVVDVAPVCVSATLLTDMLTGLRTGSAWT